MAALLFGRCYQILWIDKIFAETKPFEQGSLLVLGVIVFLLFFYGIFQLITFEKREMLYFMYDMRYHFLRVMVQRKKTEETVSKDNF